MPRPHEWHRVVLSEVCESIVDCVNKTAPVADEPTPFKMIRTTNVRDGWVNLDEVKFVTEEVFAKWTRRQLPRRGDVILTREAPLGEVGMLRSDDTVFLGQRLVSYRADPAKLDNRFLLYAFQERDLQAQIKSLGSGATVEHMRVPDAEKLTLRLPPLPVQRHIADILSAYDDLIENNARRIQILEEMARSLYREWFIEFRFPENRKARFVGHGDARIPSGWAVETLGKAASFISRGVSPKYADDGPEVVVNQKCIRDQRLSLEPARRHATKVPAEKYVRVFDVLINSTGVGTLGRVAQALADLKGCTVDTHVSIVRPGPAVTPHFWGYALMAKEPYFEAQGAGATGQTELARTRIGETPIVLPPRELQAKFDKLVARWRDSATILQTKQRVLQTTRDLLLPRLISGDFELQP